MQPNHSCTFFFATVFLVKDNRRTAEELETRWLKNNNTNKGSIIILILKVRGKRYREVSKSMYVTQRSRVHTHYTTLHKHYLYIAHIPATCIDRALSSKCQPRSVVSTSSGSFLKTENLSPPPLKTS